MNDYQDILAEVGYPTDVLCLDFESYFDAEYSLSKMSTIEYIRDSRFELTGLGLKYGEHPGIFIPPDDIEAELEVLNRDHDTTTVLVQNARFDITILQEYFGIVPKYITDLKDLASHYDSRMSHRLKDLAKMHKLKPKGDTMNFKGLRWCDMTPYQRMKLAKYTINDVELETELFKLLLPKLSNPKVELALARHTLDLWLHKRFVVDLNLARTVKTKMRGKIASAIQASGKTPKELRSKKFAGWLQEALPDGEEVPMKPGKRGNIPALAKADEACQQLLVHPNREVRDLLVGRLAAKSWPTHLKRVQSLISQTLANGGLLRVPLTYYGGHTGRWGGSEKINLQNLGGKGRGVENDELIQIVKQLIQAPDGYKLGIADSSQIEARVLAWLAGQQDLLDGFARSEDVYSVFATRLFGCEVRNPTEDDPPDVASDLEIKRGFGKDAILGAGYGMGATRFYNNCLVSLSLRPLFDSGQYDFKFVKQLIDLYRRKYAKIPAYWKAVETAFRRVIRFPHLEVKAGRVTFRNDNGTVEIELPSGRILYYRHCKIDRKDSIKWHHGTLWGGSITENIDQSISRDLLGYWILECEKVGLPVVLHVHDDIKTLLPVDQAEEGLAKQMSIMRSLPEWASGLPVDVKGKLSDTL
jgi:DNA polymerase